MQAISGCPKLSCMHKIYIVFLQLQKLFLHMQIICVNKTFFFSISNYEWPLWFNSKSLSLKEFQSVLWWSKRKHNTAWRCCMSFISSCIAALYYKISFYCLQCYQFHRLLKLVCWSWISRAWNHSWTCCGSSEEKYAVVMIFQQSSQWRFPLWHLSIRMCQRSPASSPAMACSTLQICTGRHVGTEWT